ncbi:MAG: DEAD/DEAH box helicase [Acidobacteriia bacterium]|nr:DEAD/DEAH box helicase [Terriglobia bacterium]
MRLDQLGPNIIIKGPIFPEPVQIIVVNPVGEAFKVIAKGLQSGRVHEPILSPAQLDSLEAVTTQTFDGDAVRFRLAIEALRLGLAYEYDPYFALSIARVDPLPHQLEAVYDYFLELPRIRFLLADDPGAGKTIMAGLLLKELKIRGLVQRTLIVTPANLTFQWQRELQDKFHEKFQVIRGSVLRANYGQNPWQDRNQVITSISWVSRIEEAKDSLLRSNWDLIIVDEAHKMSAYNTEKKTLAYQLGELLSEKTDHYLLMTATPHKGDAENFCLFLALLDRDVYGDVSSLEEALKRSHAPFYLRRTKQALYSFPDTETGEVKKLFMRRHVRTVPFEIDADEQKDLYGPSEIPETQRLKSAKSMTWRGEIPPQKWMNFYMKVLSRFAVAGGLKLEVTAEIRPPGGITAQQTEETRQCLRELGLSDSVNKD